MRVVKAIFVLVLAVVFGFIIHNNWRWLNQTEPIVFFTYNYDKAPEPEHDVSADAQKTEAQKMEYRLQTIPLPIWLYILGALFLGALFVGIGAIRDIYVSRRDRKRALAELEEHQSRHAAPKKAKEGDDPDLDEQLR
jgi:hypothetical protein